MGGGAMTRQDNMRFVSFYDRDSLDCPGCGESQLHHYHVSVHDRVEDAAVCKSVIVSTPGDHPDHEWLNPFSCIVHETNNYQNPSKRRHGMAISFWCEHCDKHPVLMIGQHKGLTYMRWGVTGDKL
jgi:hypothetical protein